MKKFILLISIAMMLSINALAHTAFTLVSSEKKTMKMSEVLEFEKQRIIGKADKANLVFAEKEIRLIVLTGPEDDMLSFRIQGMRNPNLVVPAGATMRILFVNVDVDMRHDVRFGHVVGEFPIQPDIAETAGSSKLAAKGDDGVLQAEEMVIKASGNGAFKYFCSVRGHAKGGMWGNILVGMKPGDDLKVAPKIEHVHSADEDKDHAHDEKPATPPAGAKPAPKPTATPHDHGAPPAAKPTATPHDHGTPAPATVAVTRHDHGTPAAATPAAGAKPHDMAGMGHAGGGAMHSTVNLGEPMTREASGTSWVPDSSPTYAYMKMYEDGGMLMLHGVGFLRYTSIGSSRDVSIAGDGSRSRADAPTMFMAMYSRPISERSQLGIRTMFSLDPIIERGYGYPLLYQSGELHKGQRLHDRQHPHDFISEMAATYSYRFDRKNSLYVYAGLPGEPALGPSMYLHRASGMNMPDAPIGHHWQDATHVAFGVVTGGFTHDKVKFEVSAFNGTEPDERRFAFDKPRLNSFSGRLSFNPTKNLALQVSHGYLRNPERSEPDLKVLRRTTASAIYNRSFSEDRNWANTFVWGQNYAEGEATNSFLYESNYEFYKNAIFGRLEQVQKNAHELVLPSPHPEGNFWVSSYSIGYLRDIVKDKGVDVGIGGMATINHNPSAISSFYGGTTHGGWQLYLRFRPSRSGH
ncbi:MAG: hypothetical protein ABR530_09735 [Pyrinomonadaceae bacterium]